MAADPALALESDVATLLGALGAEVEVWDAASGGSKAATLPVLELVSGSAALPPTSERASEERQSHGVGFFLSLSFCSLLLLLPPRASLPRLMASPIDVRRGSEGAEGREKAPNLVLRGALFFSASQLLLLCSSLAGAALSLSR